MTGKRTQQKPITNLAEAWRYLAEIIDRPPRKIEARFLCLILSGDTDFKGLGFGVLDINPHTRRQMIYRIEQDLAAGTDGDSTYGMEDNNPVRVLVCLMFALEAEDAETKWSAA